MNAKARIASPSIIDAAARDQRLPHPAMFRRYPIKMAIHLAPTDMRATPEQVDTFRAFASQGDPLADAMVEEMRNIESGHGRRLFERALENGIDFVPEAGPALKALFHEVDAIPYWLDQNKLALGARTIQRTGLMGAYGALVDVSLMGGYLARKALKVLTRTGEIGQKAPRRIAETALWWMSVTDPGGLERHADGFKNTLRVRVTHAQVRAAMNRASDWNFAEWDTPVNQPQMAGTQLLFSLIGVLGMRVMGFRFTTEEVDAVIHLWRYVGHLIGVHHALLPANESDAWRLMWMLAETEFQPDNDSRALATALRDALPQLHGLTDDNAITKWVSGLVVNYHSALSRLVLGSDNGDALGLDGKPMFTLAVAATSAVNFGVESVRKLIPGATAVSVRLGRSSRRLAMNRLAPPLNPDLTFSRDHHIKGH